MTKSKHTPAPWKRWTTNAPHAPVIIYTGDIAPKLNAKGYPVCEAGTFIAEVSTNHMHLDENDDIVQHDNARLIAAAPELLEALEYMVREQEREGFGDEMEDIKRAYAAIKKARGE